MTAVGTAFITGVLAVSVLFAQDSKKDEPLKKMMETKLEISKKLLGAVAQNDFVKINTNSEELIKISNELAKKFPKNERFQELGKEYRNELQGLLKAVQKQNTEAISLAYVKTTLACFNCHTFIRDTRFASR
jgi:cytochrome c556